MSDDADGSAGMKRDRRMTGYLDSQYAKSFSELGRPHELPRSRGWILIREIPGFPLRDGMGCYPLFCCQDWGQLCRDLDEIGDDMVSVSLVTDPFGDYDPSYLRRCFPAVSQPFKQHFVVDLSRPLETFASKHHRRNARKALQVVQVEPCQNPIQFLDEWVTLYANLTTRYDIKGIRAFSRQAFARQLQIPGIVAFRALHQGQTVGMLLWYIQGELGYYHLGAYDQTGYQLLASFALFWHAIEYFENLGGIRWLTLGAGAGINPSGEDGLSRFKRGWATGTRTTYFCGRIFDRDRYAEVTHACRSSSSGYFPAYRKNEFA